MLTYGKSPMAEQVPPKWHEKKGCREAGYNSRSLHPKASESTSWSSPLRTRSPGGEGQVRGFKRHQDESWRVKMNTRQRAFHGYFARALVLTLAVTHVGAQE